MLKSKELSEPSSCLNKARPDELIFVLLARDAAASSTVRHWVAERLRLGKNKAEDPQMIEALAWADRVQREHEHAMVAATGLHDIKTCEWCLHPEWHACSLPRPDEVHA